MLKKLPFHNKCKAHRSLHI